MKQLNDKVFCRCEVGHCFLEKDAAWCSQNFAESENGFRRDVAWLNHLDTERLQQTDQWMDSLGVIGTLQVYCLHKKLNGV
ncbi:MAG: hypothetical protein EPN17_08815 [Methylobacter sp.]|nr:MAG: hypothetical protein EPN17_08815 [Methylobacter sp.]